MTIFWKAAGIVVLTVILSVTIGKQEKDISVVLTATACCGVACLGIYALSDSIAFLWEICSYSDGQSSFMGPILKIVGVAIVTEITAMISMDAGCGSLEKAMQFLGNATILSLAQPLFERFIELVQEILNIV
jgi:stage III sporulation protein AD